MGRPTLEEVDTLAVLLPDRTARPLPQVAAEEVESLFAPREIDPPRLSRVQFQAQPIQDLSDPGFGLLARLLVQRPVADAVVERLAAAISALRIGMPWEDGVVITPLPDPEKPAFLEGLVRDAVAHGAAVVNPGGGAWKATLYVPALVHPVPPEALLYHEEQFGPVVPVSVFDHADEALDVADRSEVGQQASIFGRDPAVIGHLVDHLASMVCRVNLDTQCRRGPDVFPFTGRKDSAVGTLSVHDALRTFSIRSLVAVPEKERALLQSLGARSKFLAPPPGEPD